MAKLTASLIDLIADEQASERAGIAGTTGWNGGSGGGLVWMHGIFQSVGGMAGARYGIA